MEVRTRSHAPHIIGRQNRPKLKEDKEIYEQACVWVFVSSFDDDVIVYHVLSNVNGHIVILEDKIDR